MDVSEPRYFISILNRELKYEYFKHFNKLYFQAQIKIEHPKVELKTDNEISGEKIAQFYALLMKAEDATEKEEIIRKTKDWKKRTELFRAKTAREENQEESVRSTPNGIYHGSIGSDDVFRTNSAQEKWYAKPTWYRWDPNGPKDLNEDEFYQNMNSPSCERLK